MAVSLFLMPAGAFAAESGVISGENCSAEAGETILYTVDISGNPGLAGFMVYVACDTSVFDTGQTQAALGSFSDSGSIFMNPESEDGWRVLWFNAQNVSGNGTLFTLEISVADDAASGTYPVKITLSPENTVNAAGELVDFSCIDGSIVVSGGTDAPIDEDEKPQPSQEPEEPNTQDPEQPDDDNQTDPEDEPEPDAERPVFVDVPATHWAYEYVKELARRKETTPARIAIGWLLAQKPWIVPIPGTKRIERIKENIGGADIRFTTEELADIRRHLDSIEIIGARYPEDQEALTGK